MASNSPSTDKPDGGSQARGNAAALDKSEAQWRQWPKRGVRSETHILLPRRILEGSAAEQLIQPTTSQIEWVSLAKADGSLGDNFK